MSGTRRRWSGGASNRERGWKQVGANPSTGVSGTLLRYGKGTT